MAKTGRSAIDRRKFIQLAGAAGVATVVGARVTPTRVFADTAASGGELVVGLDAEPPTLDPQASPSVATYPVVSSVFESLLYQNDKHELKPWLAETWEVNADSTAFTFHLRKDVVFHDGEPFNADTVKWNFDRVVDPNFQAGGALAALYGYTGSKVIDDYTVEVQFSKPFAPFLTQAAGGSLGIVSPKAVQSLGSDFATKPVGSGPFKVDSYTAGDNVVIVRNDDYKRQAPWSDRTGPALLDKVTFRFIPEASTRSVTVETGETNLINTITAQDLPRFDGNDDFAVAKIPWGGVPRTLFLNFKLGPTDDVNVRKAVNLAIDRQSLVNTVFKGLAEPSIGFLTKSLLDDPSLSFPYDPDQAKSLLDKAGWVKGDGDVRQKDGKKLTFVLNAVDLGAGAPPETQFVQANLIDVGFDATIKLQARAPWYEDNYKYLTNGPIGFIRSGDFDAAFSAFHSSLIGKNFNFSGVDLANIDDLLERGRQESDPTARRKTYLDLEHALQDISASAPLVDEYAIWVGQKKVQGLTFNGACYPVFSDVSITN
ncbi:MAG TPA: ABC transporter substrate-binding protein [Thermomicrobiales bacterium]|nr:ABC transporter substrate-binding protein [Thermomicrobiales bacterium]